MFGRCAIHDISHRCSLFSLLVSTAAAEVLFLAGNSQGDVVTFIILSILKTEREKSYSQVISLDLSIAGMVQDYSDLASADTPMVSMRKLLTSMFYLNSTFHKIPPSKGTAWACHV